jgi:hypothetical protein
MTASELHAAFLRAFASSVVRHGQLGLKPLSVDLAPPRPPRLRLYMYSLVGGVGTSRPPEYKASLRLRGQGVGEYDSFDFSEERLALLVGYARDLDVFVLWDPSLHPRFKNGGNIQVKASTVHLAAALGRAEQRRHLYSGVDELVIACQTPTLPQALDDRVASTGGLARRADG